MITARDEQLYETFKKIWKEKPHLSFDEVIEEVLCSAQPRLWVGFSGVYRILRRILYGKEHDPNHKARGGLKGHIERQYFKLRKQVIFRKASPYFIASFIQAEPSRGFYISHSRAKIIIYKQRKLHARRKNM